MSFRYLQFFKKMNETIWPNYFCYYGTSSRIVFVRFFGELKIPKRHFEINWPLVRWWAGKTLSRNASGTSAAVRNAAGPRFEIIFGGERAIRMGVAGTGWGRLGQAAGRKEWVEFKRRSNVTALQKLEVEKDERSKVEVGFRRKCSDALPLCFVWLQSNYSFRASH